MFQGKKYGYTFAVSKGKTIQRQLIKIKKNNDLKNKIMELVLLFAAIVSMMMLTLFIFTYDNTINVERLPMGVKAFVQNSFPGEDIDYAMVEPGITRTTYGVHLKSGVDLNLDVDGNWDKVDCNTKEVPELFIPSTIKHFVQSNYSDAVITKIDKGRDSYLVELSNNLYLKFTDNGQLIGFGY